MMLLKTPVCHVWYELKSKNYIGLSVRKNKGITNRLTTLFTSSSGLAISILVKIMIV
jgi:hypothetical protein